MKYLFQRYGSQNYWIRLLSPGKRIEKSLGTPDRHQAELLALPLIAEHKAALQARRPRLEAAWGYRLEPGREHIGADGQRIIATERELLILDGAGRIVRREPNGGPALRMVPDLASFPEGKEAERDATLWRLLRERESRPTVARKSDDDAIFETYLRHAGITGANEREARKSWDLFRTLTAGKALRDCTREDGRTLVGHMLDAGLKSTSVKRKLAALNAACNLAIGDGKIRFNPFAGVIPKRDDAMRRLPLGDDDMAACRARLDTLSAADALLWKLLAATGMRLSEAFQIDREQREDGHRFVVIGTKTANSKRRVPLPDFVPPVKGALFAGAPNIAGHRLGDFIRACGIADKRKTLHCLRHRAADRLRAAGCPEGIRHELLGHEKRTIADGYGKGSPVRLLREWQERIGC